MNNSKRFTTLSILIGLVCLTGCPNLTGAHKSEGEEQASKWAKELGLEYQSVSCVKQDTDGDGYVSCTLNLGEGRTKQVECAGAWNLNSGCREPKLKMPTVP